MSTKTPAGIFNYSDMNDKDKAYLIKLLGTIFMGVVSGIITGLTYTPTEQNTVTIGWTGMLIWLISTVALTFLIKSNFDLTDMKDSQIFRHGIFMGFFSYLYFWTIIFNFILF